MRRPTARSGGWHYSFATDGTDPGPIRISGDASLPETNPAADVVQFSDLSYEVNFSTLSCAELKKLLQKATDILMTIKSKEGYKYYEAKAAAIQSAMSSVCSASPSPTLGGSSPAVVVPIVTNSGGAAGGGGGAGSGSATAKATDKKFDWWLLAAIAALGIALYQTDQQ